MEPEKEVAKEAEPMRDEPPAAPHFSALGVLQLTFSVFWKNPLLYLIIALIMNIPGIVLALFTAPEIGMRLGTHAGSVFSSIFAGPIAYSVYKGLLGEQTGIGEAMERGLSHYRSLIGLSIISNILTFCIQSIGNVFGNIGVLIAFGGMAYYWAVYAVITPVCVVERLSATESFLRGATLTQGYRWGVCRLYFLIVLLLFMTLGIPLLLMALYGISPTPALYAGTGFKIAMQIAAIIITTIFEVGFSILYYQLRSFKEGAATDKLARVFE